MNVRAVTGNRIVQHGCEALHDYLKDSYRDLHEAHARLGELMKSDGTVSTARRVSSDPSQLGELPGKTGCSPFRRVAESATEPNV